MDLVQTLVQSISDSSQKMIGFKDDRSGRYWLRNFLKRHTEISLRRRIALDKCRCMAINPQNVAKQFCRLRAVMKKFDILDPSIIFNLEESGFSIKGMNLGR